MQGIYVPKGRAFQIPEDSFAIAETLSGYTLYCSVSCSDTDKASKAWADAAGGVPEGWKACSDPIPADTQHFVYDNVDGCYFFMKGLTDDNATVRY